MRSRAHRLLPPNGHPLNFVKAFPPVPQSAGEARRFVREELAPHGIDPAPAEQVASELVANVADHAHTPMRVSVVVGPSVRIEVYDGNGIIPAVEAAAADAEHGRGLAIVEAYATAWGVKETKEGKMIWVELERTPAG